MNSCQYKHNISSNLINGIKSVNPKDEYEIWNQDGNKRREVSYYIWKKLTEE